MPFTKLKFRPGINRDTTNYANEGGWYECDKIRFFSGYPQKLGGWIESTSERFAGTCRQMWNWITSYTDNFLALGTNEKVYIEAGGVFYDITPLRYTSSAGDVQFLATNGSSTIIVSDPGFGSLAGDYVTFVDSTDLGGNITDDVLDQNYVIVSVIDADTYTIQAKNPSTGAPVLANASDVTSDTFTADSSTDTITFSSYTPTDGERFYLSNSGGALPAGLSANVTYYAISSASTSCQLSLTSSGSAENFTDNGTGTQTASVFGGGASAFGEYQIPVGFPSITAGYGWGSGPWNGSYGWGLSSSTPIYFPQQDWWLDNFDNDLVMNIRAITTNTGVATGGPIYYWERGTSVNPSTALATPAELLSGLTIGGVSPSDVPESANQILVSQNDKHLLAFGCQPYGGSSGDFDPLLIRWATQDQPNVWEPLPTNSAGFIRVSRGSRIIRAIPTRQEIAVFTDTHLFSLQFLGTTDVFGLQELADNISIMGPRAVISANNVTYWMGLDKFYRYDGRVQTLSCSLREYVFKDLNFAQADQVICGTNEGFNEIWWFYPSGTSTWVDRYVVYNHLDNVWFYGQLGRTAWLDVSSRQLPTAVYTDPDQNPGILYIHESGIDAAGLPMESFIQSSDVDIDDGEKFILTRRMIPDISFNTSTAANPEVDLAIRPRNFPGSNFQNDPSDTQRVINTSFGVYTNQVFVRARARQLALKVSSDTLGVQWQLGDVRVDGRPDGKQ
jgi:hypothetical protein